MSEVRCETCKCHVSRNQNLIYSWWPSWSYMKTAME